MRILQEKRVIKRRKKVNRRKNDSIVMLRVVKLLVLKIFLNKNQIFVECRIRSRLVINKVQNNGKSFSEENDD